MEYLEYGNVIGWKVYANDSADQWNFTDIFTFIVENTPPTTVLLSWQENGSSTYDRTPYFNWTDSYDADGDSINYSFVIEENYCPTGTYQDECVGTNINVDEIIINLPDELMKFLNN